MPNTYKLSVTGLDRRDINGLQAVVVKVRWTMTGTDEYGHSAEFSGWTDYNSVDSSKFIIFDNLTEAEILSWLSNDPQTEGCKRVIDERIEHVIAPVEKVALTELPWNKSRTPPIVVGDTSGIAPTGV